MTKRWVFDPEHPEKRYASYWCDECAEQGITPELVVKWWQCWKHNWRYHGFSLLNVFKVKNLPVNQYPLTRSPHEQQKAKQVLDEVARLYEQDRKDER
jgi:hypothetical protein